MRKSITGRLWQTLALLVSCLLPASTCAQVPIVVAEHYDAFWLWAGVAPQSALQHARTVYLLDAEVRPGTTALISQRPALPHVPHAEVWMVVRVETLHWSATHYQQVLRDLTRWQSAGNHVVGLQIDFDAHTYHLEEYAAFLHDLRQRLPTGYRLGITGLLDWSSNGDSRGLQALAEIVDEVVLQIYQGHHVIPGYAQYLSRLGNLRIPFRVGLLQGAEWQPPPSLPKHPYFRGVVVFLQNTTRRPR